MILPNKHRKIVKYQSLMNNKDYHVICTGDFITENTKLYLIFLHTCIT